MGLEARCTVTWQGSSWTAGVHLDSVAIEVRGRPRLVVPLASVRRVEVVAGGVRVDTSKGALELAVGAASETWARRITSPPSRCKKLGIASGHKVSLIGLDAPDLESELSEVGATRVGPRGKADVVLFAVHAPADLERLPPLLRRIAPDGALWVVREKGKAAAVREAQVREAARAVGLVDVKVAAFSDTLTADKWVIPVGDRGATSRSAARGDELSVAGGRNRPSPPPRAPRRSRSRG